MSHAASQLAQGGEGGGLRGCVEVKAVSAGKGVKDKLAALDAELQVRGSADSKKLLEVCARHCNQTASKGKTALMRMRSKKKSCNP